MTETSDSDPCLDLPQRFECKVLRQESDEGKDSSDLRQAIHRGTGY